MLKVKDKSSAISLYWIAQALVCIFATNGLGPFPFIGGIAILLATFLQKTSSEVGHLISNILYVLYSCALVAILVIIALMFGFHLIQIPLYLVSILNFYCIYISHNHKE